MYSASQSHVTDPTSRAAHMTADYKQRGTLTVVTGCAGYLAVFLGVLFMAVAAVFLFFFRNQIGPLFVDDARVGGEVAGVAPICAAYQMPDGVYGVASGVLRCTPLQNSLFIIILSCVPIIGYVCRTVLALG